MLCRSPRLIYRVVGLSRDDVLTAVHQREAHIPDCRFHLPHGIEADEIFQASARLAEIDPQPREIVLQTTSISPIHLTCRRGQIVRSVSEQQGLFHQTIDLLALLASRPLPNGERRIDSRSRGASLRPSYAK